jgi:hypothetical protein
MRYILRCAKLFTAIGLLGVPLVPAGAMTRHVPSEYATIQAGLDASAFGDTVLVAPGIYTDSEERVDGFPTRSCAFMKDGVVLLSEAGPETTTIDLLGEGSAQAAVIWCRNLPSEETVIEGFSVTGTNPVRNDNGAYVAVVGKVTFRDCIFRDMDAGQTTGAGIAANGDIDVIECEFANCVAFAGGGVYHSNGHINLIRSIVRQCGSIGALLDGNPGGPDESALIEDCVFRDNFSEGMSGGLAISFYNLGATVRRCRFENNVAYGTGGGGMTFTNFGSKVIEDCLFLNNSAITSNGQGGAVQVAGNGACTIRGNTFHGNWQDYEFFGGAAVYIGAWTVFERNIVSGSYGNTAVFVEEALGGHLVPSCNVYWANEDGIGVPLGDTDREVDPQFCDPENDDFTVSETSPCVEPGSLGCGQIGAFGIGCGTVAIDAESWGKIKAQFREGERP